MRLLVESMRKDGLAILSDFRGYYLPSTTGDHLDYERFRQRMGVAHLIDASVNAHGEAHASSTGQIVRCGKRVDRGGYQKRIWGTIRARVGQ